jgi:hypothetical protein
VNEPEPVHVLTQLQAAMHQLDRAALLFVDCSDYLSAITLAGAADEILGQYVRDRGGTAVLDDQKRFSTAREWSHLSEKQVNDQHLNVARNCLKHKQHPEDELGRFAWRSCPLTWCKSTVRAKARRA